MKAASTALCVLSMFVLSGATSTFGQSANQPATQPGGPLPPADTEVGKLLPVNSSTPMTPEMEAERVKIWNSPMMLRARAWAQEYCHASARVTPEEAKDYMNELQRMTPTQMKLWLLKFEHEQEMMARQQAMFEQSRRAGVQQALGIDRGIQQAYGRINRDENEAAQVEEGTINEERINAQENARMNQQNLNIQGEYGGGLGYGYGYGYGYGPYAPYGPVQSHYHFHYY